MKQILFFVFLIIGFVSCNPIINNGQDTGEGVFEGLPKINKPSVVGNYPNTPFLFAVPTSGKRPIEWLASKLPEGLSIDSKTGFITGSVEEPDTFEVEITATNELGSDTKPLTIVIGETLALTPPLGWNSWNTFTDQISDSLLRQIADSLVSTGMRDLGYQYINIDDYWQLVDRDANGKIQVNKQKFPKGIKAVADYVHSKGLKLGIYSDAACLTCGGVAGSYGHEVSDANDFADWGIDLLKYDYCYAPSPRDTAIERYSRMAKALRNTRRSIVFSVCEWGGRLVEFDGVKFVDSESNDGRRPQEWAAQIGGNSWRTTCDIRNIWNADTYGIAINSIMQILDLNAPLDEYASPGHWNDPDILVVGVKPVSSSPVFPKGYQGCSDVEYRSHMSLWCLMASPLLCGNDLRSMDAATKKILLNPEIIAINQDELGKQAKRIIDNGDTEVFAKLLSDGAWAIGLLNRNDNQEKTIRINWDDINLSGKISVRDLWQRKDLGAFPEGFEAKVPVHGCMLIKVK